MFKCQLSVTEILWADLSALVTSRVKTDFIYYFNPYQNKCVASIWDECILRYNLFDL